MKAPRAFVSILALLLAGLSPAQASEKTVQIDLGPLLNCRLVTTVQDGKLTLWPDSLDNSGSGMATQAAADLSEPKGLKALPNDGYFPATAKRPEVRLYARNDRPEGPQARRSIGEDRFDIPVSSLRCREFWLFFMSGCGDSQLHATLTYADGSSEKRDLKAPDWWNPANPANPIEADLAVDLGKWDDKNKMMETDHHFIVGLNLQPKPSLPLVRVEVSKEAPAVLTLWAATALVVE